MLLLVIYSQGFYGTQQSNIPIYVALGIMITFPIIMRFIFVQDCSIKNFHNNLPDAVPDHGSTTTGAGLRAMTAADGDSKERLKKKQSLSCILEKYGGIQSMFCASLIIMILTRTHQVSDKGMAFGIMILLTYGLSQTFIQSNVYE